LPSGNQAQFFYELKVYGGSGRLKSWAELPSDCYDKSGWKTVFSSKKFDLRFFHKWSSIDKSNLCWLDVLE
jgi:hypothetical protein